MWLLLMHQLPPDPSYLRVKVRRRLRRMGAAALKNTVYVLPGSDAARESFEWLAQEIRVDGGDAILCQVRFIGGVSDEEVRDLFRAERDAEYARIVKELEEIEPDDPDTRLSDQLTRSRRRLEANIKLDFFDAPGRRDAERAIANAEALLAIPPEPMSKEPVPPLDDLRRKVWVTRRGVHVDRMASAWLIRRFIDPDARFRFVDPDGFRPGPDEIRYDMYEAEFTHDGDRCTFEVLAALVAPEDTALQAIAEIVHEIDLDDGKFRRTEVAGIERLIAGIQAAHPNDGERLARAADMFEGLYRSFGGAD